MLNELYDLAQCLRESRVAVDSWHRHFKPCPRGYPTYLALLDANACIAGIERVVDADRITSIRKWEIENGVSFPALNILPLYEPNDEDTRKRVAQFRKALVSQSPPSSDESASRIGELIRTSRPLWSGSRAAKINKSVMLHAERLASQLGTPPPEYRAIAELISRAGRVSADALHRQLQERLELEIRSSPATAAAFLDVLFFYKGRTPKNVSLVLELLDHSQFPYPANHEAVQEWMNSRLQSVTTTDDDDDSASVVKKPDAYARPAVSLNDRFPLVRVPILGNVILRAMSSESPCQRRYAVADSKSCPVGEITRKEAKSALEWISHPDRHEKTWSDVSSLTGKATVLYAYPSEAPDPPPELAGLIAGLDSDNDADGARFEACSSRVASVLRGRGKAGASDGIRVFVLLKADVARTKVLKSRHVAASHLVRSAEEWERQARNIPFIAIRQFGKKKGEPAFWADPLTPFPADVAWCVNTAWTRAGTHAEQVCGFDIGDGLDLLLEQGVRLNAVATRLLHTFVCNSQSLLLVLGQEHHQGRVHLPPKKYGRQPLLLPCILGVLLAKLGRERGDYMRSPPFLVGRMLSLADQLHVRYCHGVRKDQIPAQLIGNAIMATALEQPQKALALLSQRILPYQRWASTIQEREHVGLAKYFLRELGRVADELAECALPIKCSDMDKAEMLLGYLAYSEKEKSADMVSSTNIEGANA